MLIFFSKIKKILIAGVLLFITVTCSKDPYQNFPNVPVNISLSKTALSSIGFDRGMVVAGGVKGIIIFNVGPDLDTGLNTYYAFDRLCTNYPNDTCTVAIDNSGVYAICPCCQSKYFLMEGGSVSAGPSQFPLRQYTASFDGNRLLISN